MDDLTLADLDLAIERLARERDTTLDPAAAAAAEQRRLEMLDARRVLEPGAPERRMELALLRDRT